MNYKKGINGAEHLEIGVTQETWLCDVQKEEGVDNFLLEIKPGRMQRNKNTQIFAYTSQMV